MTTTKNNQKITLFFFIFSLGLIITFIVLDILFYNYKIKDRIMSNTLDVIKEQELYLKKEMDLPKDILLSLRQSNKFTQYLKQPKQYQQDLNDLFLILAKQNANIMQLRYLTPLGKEAIRIDRPFLKVDPFVVKETSLQDKSSRYYFKDSKQKPLETVWFSNLDLNMEQGKVEIPYKPTLRAMLPIHYEGKFHGVLIINYHMKDILDELFIPTLYDMILVNDLGYALIHYNKSKNWTFYQESQKTIHQEFPEYFSKIMNSKELLTKEFLSKKLSINVPNKLILILKIRTSYFDQYKNDRTVHYIIVGLITIFLSSIMSFVFSNYLKKLFLVLQDTKALNRLLNKKVEDKTEEIFSQQQQYQNIIQTINDFIWEVDKSGVYTYVSPQTIEILGYEPKEMIGRTPFDFMPKEEALEVADAFSSLVSSSQPIIQLQNKNIHKEGQLVYLETSGNPIYDSNNSIIGYRGTDRDVTQKVLAQQEIEQHHLKIQELNKNLESRIKEEVEKNHEKDTQLFAQSKMAAMGDMIKNIAHQWRQPLSVISTTSSGIKLNQEFNQLDIKTLPKQMDNILEQTQYLSETIDTFMSFLKDKKELKTVNLAQSLQQVIEIVQPSLDSCHITTKANLEAISELTISTISTELQEVLINIINNSIDAINTNNIKDGQVTISAKEDNTHIILIIEDNGGGIPTDIMDRIFEPYFTTKHASQGTGLGLHMVYRIVKESLHGNIYVKNNSQGASFFIELPRS